MTGTWRNQLYFGDNLDVLRQHVPDASVDLPARGCSIPSSRRWPRSSRQNGRTSGAYVRSA